MALVSVIMPTFNRAPLISASIKSVLAQTNIDFEIIVVDDGSTDNTREVIAGFKDPRIKYIYQENSGVSAARNTAIETSTGKYIAFLDSDDILVEKSLGKRVGVLERHSQAAFSYGKAYLMDEKGHIFGFRKQQDEVSYVQEGRDEIKKAILNGNQIPTSTILARRICLNKVGLFNTSFKNGSEDFDLWVRLARSYPVAYIGEPLVIYRVHGSSISRTHRLADLEESNNIIFNSIFNDPELGVYFSSERSGAYLRMYLRLADYACGGGDMIASRRYLSKALKIKPRWFLNRLWSPFIIRYSKTLFPTDILKFGHNTRRFLSARLFRYLSKMKLKPSIQNKAAA